MIKEIKIKNWKSFGETTLYLDPLTVLVGQNASGKSNLIDALDFLQRLFNKNYQTIRGEEYSLFNENLKAQSLSFEILLENETQENKLILELKKEETGGYSIFSENKEQIIFEKELKNIFILEPYPNAARNYTKISKDLDRNGGNLAGVIAALLPQKKEFVEKKLSYYAQKLPEKEIDKVWIQKIGLGKDAMLYAQENFASQKLVIDTRSLSDGTLRFLMILTAVLTRPKGSLLVIEEIDNGIHPSKAQLLIEILLEEGKNSEIDILVTTHNVAFLNELTPQFLPFVMVVYRNEEGNSSIMPIDESKNLARLLAKRLLGDILTDTQLNKSLTQ